MKNPFDILTSIFIDKPKICLSIGLVGILTISSMAMFIEFDNSEDAFFPDNETVRLLDEVEGEYQASLDFVRIIARMPDGGLDSSDNWVHLAALESILLEDQNLSEYAYPLFGSAPNNGPASIALSWERHNDPLVTEGWSDPIEIALEQLDSSNSQNETQDALDSLIFAMQRIPSPAVIDSVMLRGWEPSDPTIWLDRLVSGQNSTGIIERTMLSISTIDLGDENFNNTRDASMAKLGALAGMQEVDYASALRSTLPVADHGDLSSADGPMLISFVVTTESDAHGGVALGEIQSKVNTWTGSIEVEISETGDETSSVFSYSQLLLGQNENLGRELGILNSVSLLILGTILWFSFRSKRDTGYVLGLTVLGIGATYGTSGALTAIGVPMTFNAAMNSIPVLLLAIGVDYGLHVVKRVREEYQVISSSTDRSVESVGAMDQTSRRAAILRGTKFTSIALLIAIFTDMVGFLSFRLSSQEFLVVFGTVIAIGLFYIYVLSITALPALMALFPPKDMLIKKTVKIDEGWLSKKIGALTRLPIGVVSVAILVSLPAVMGIQKLEVGFDTRDNFDESVPVVSDFILISEQFQSSPSPLYVVLDGDVISPEGREMVEKVIQKLSEDDRVALVTSDLWSTLESERAYEPELDIKMDLIDSGSPGGWEELSNWLLSTDKGRDLSSGLFSSSGDQTVISFQASTLDWTATTVFQADMTESINQATYGSAFEASLSGRSLILAQITADVAEAAVVSTSVVAGVILLMLLVIQTGRTGDPLRGIKRGFVAWLPLMAVVAWVFGIMGYTGFQLNSQTVTIGALTLGLGVDYAIHIATRLEEEAEHDPLAGPEVWVSRAVSTTGRAMGAAAITTAGGFSVLNLSSLVPLQLFGQAFVVAITLALISSLFVLTPLYAKLLEGEIA
tara:strand:+ start:173320 stop:176049 length:2730 start_codon:yes stop_codon:yes gene_type:complete